MNRLTVLCFDQKNNIVGNYEIYQAGPQVHKSVRGEKVLHVVTFIPMKGITWLEQQYYNEVITEILPAIIFVNKLDRPAFKTVLI